jgi:hypothetical protein
MVDLRKEKETLTKQLADARSIVAQKKAEAAKAVATLKEKESVLGKTAAATAAPVESATKDVPAKVKPAAAIPMQTVATSTISANSKMAIEKKEEKQVMPKVPLGGFKFAPSKTLTTIPTGSLMAKKKSDTEADKKRTRC